MLSVSVLDFSKNYKLFPKKKKIIDKFVWLFLLTGYGGGGYGGYGGKAEKNCDEN